nr:MAG: ORF1 [Torque teno midi virus]
MPFWWRRRRKPWYTGGWIRRNYARRTRRKRFYKRRRKYRPFTRRRRRRRRTRKVRRKRKTLIVKQWQPDSIKKCKIKGLGFLVGGAEGSQFFCYTNQKEKYTVPKAPGGGGFGVEVYTLRYLYNQWKAHKNIWTKSNLYMDLCRYTGCKITLYRHQTTDFIIQYDRQPPFNMTKGSYPSVHPQNMLLARHHRVLLSTKNNPKGKNKITLKIKPTKQMINKWFFQEQFADFALLKIQATACNLSYSLFGPNTQSTNVTIFALNQRFYARHNWAQQTTPDTPWTPYNNYPTAGLTFKLKNSTSKIVKPTNYKQSISKSDGFFQTAVLQAIEVLSGTQITHERPICIGRYNPEEDTGQGNKVWLTSVLSDHNWVPPSDDDLIIVGEPLYIAFYGFWDWINICKPKGAYLETGMFVVQSPAIHTITPTTQTVWPLIDYDFINGRLPYGEDITVQDEQKWYPTASKQRVSINNIVESGPYIPKYANLPSSSWNLPMKYTFYFKWGGPQITDQVVQDPKLQETYPVPDRLLQTVQVADPIKQHCQSFLRAWDFRRGIATTTAIKRMSENLPIDSSLESDETETPKKKKKVTAELPFESKETKKVQSCLLSLFEEDTCPEPTEDLYKLIQQQHQQQQKLKLNLINLLMHLKKKQRHLQLQTGIE